MRLSFRVRIAFLWPLLLACLAGLPVAAQSYQTAFAGEKFDQTKGPATFHSGVEVDAATGAASMNFPLGPGIGQRGVKYVPTLRARIAPQVKVGLLVNPDGTLHLGPCIRNSPAFDLTPGHLDYLIDPAQATNMATSAGFVSNWVYPDGATSSGSGALPPGVNPTILLAGFGYAPSVTPGYLPYVVGTGTKTPFIQPGSNGEVVLGLVDPSNIPEITVVSTPIYLPVNWNIPSKILVIRGQIAYEYTYQNCIIADPNADNPKIAAGHYRLTAIRNKFNDAVTFSYLTSAGTDNGVDYSASWCPSGGGSSLSISVALTSVVPAPTPIHTLDPSIFKTTSNGDGVQAYNIANLKVTYLGVSNVSTFTLSGASKQSTLPTSPFDGFENYLNSIQITSIQVDVTGEMINFEYGVAPAVSYTDTNLTGNDIPGTYWFGPTTLTSVHFPGRIVNLDWTAYKYLPNGAKPSQQGIYFPNTGGVPTALGWAYGVSAIHDQDVSSGSAERLTTHLRVVPIPGNWGSSYPTTFTDTITRPDGSIQLLKFVEPVNATTLPIGIPTDPEIVQIQTLAYLKGMVREERDYRNSQDLASDAPYRVVVSDRWDFRRVNNGSGSVGISAVPYATRTRTWDADTQVLTIHELQSWDNTQLGWTKTMDYTYWPTASPDLSSEWLSLARTGLSPNYPAPCFDRSTTRTLGSDPSRWFWGRVTTEQRVGLPPTNRGYDPTSNLISQVKVGDDSLAVVTDYNYNGPLLTGAELSSPQGLTNTGLVGAIYGHDSFGYLSRIQPNAPSPAPVAISWSVGQSQDELGRPLTQTDANGKVTSYGLDPAGRLNAITPPDGEQPTSIQYDDTDYHGVTVTRGVQKTEYRYDGFDQLVLIRRWDGSNNVSHKTITYDPMGRTTAESVWSSGAGTDAEGWKNPGSDVTAYDGRGRVTDHTDPNGITVHTSYSGLAQTSTLGYGKPGSVSTKRIFDCIGRLIQVDDAMGYSTTYGYDQADRLQTTTQYSGPVGATPSQSRSWTYNGLGWLTQLVQPESGTTSYSNFTVTGKPQTTSYNGRVVSSSFDTLSRPVAVTSSDGLDQEFRYDGPVEYGAALGKLYYARDSGTERISTYLGIGGRLSNLNTNTWTGGALSLGTVLTCDQTFSYDSYGNRSQSTAGQSNVAPSMDYARNMVQGVSVNGTTLVSAYLDPTAWTLNSLSYINGANTTYSYDADQNRLHSMLHSSSGQPLASWIYNYDASTGRLNGDGEDSYSYDPLGRLSQATVKRLNNQGTVVQAFNYDAFGNQTSSIASGALPLPSLPGNNINNFTLNLTEQNQMAVNNHLPATASGSMTGAQYDAQGNLTQLWPVGSPGASLGLLYDSLGRVTQMSDSARGVVETYAYSTEGLRTLIQIFQSGVLQKAVFHVYNDQRQLVSEYELVQE